MNAVITAGGRVGGAFADCAGTPVKALARIRGETMLDRAIRALRGAGARRIAVVGGAEVRAACADSVERIVEESSSGSENLVRALDAWPEDGEPLLFATSDMPYVEAAHVLDFVRRVPPDTLAVSLCEFDDFAARFPGSTGFGIRLAGERVVNGGLFIIPPNARDRLAGAATALFEARKRPWRMAALVGPTAMVRFATGRLSVAHLERVAARTTGVPAMAVRNCAPELGYDADTDGDYRYACERA